MRTAAPVLLVLAAIVLVGCSSAPPVQAPAGPELPAAAVTSTSATAPAATTPPRSTRGNLIKAVGQSAYTIAPDGQFPQDTTLEFRVDAIRPGAECQAQGFTEKPKNGQYLAVDVTAATTEKFVTGRDDGYFLGISDLWSVVTADGRRVSGDSGNGWICSPPSVRDLEDLTPAISVQGTLLLDVPADLAGAVLVVRSGAGDAGWEWQIPG